MNKTFILPGLMCDERLWSKMKFENHTFISIPKYSDIKMIINSLHKTIDSYEKVNLIGFSFGGYLALEYAIKYPLYINKIAIISSGIDATSEDENLNRQKVLQNIDKLNFKSINTKIFENLFEKKDDKNVYLLKEMFQKQGLEKYKKQLTASLQKQCLYEKLLHLDINTLFINSSHDKLVKTNSISKLCKEKKVFKQYILNSNSHMLPLEYESLLQKQIDSFLDKKTKAHPTFLP